MKTLSNYFVTFLKQLTPPVIWSLKNIFKKKYYALDELDKKIQGYLDYEKGFFIEIGANNGIEQSNTFFLEKEKKWKGILVEPILHKYLECKKNRSKRNKYYCCACVSKKYKKKYVDLFYSNLMTVPINLESEIKNKFKHANFSNQIRKKRDEREIEVVKFSSRAITLDKILDESNAPKLIDFFSLDVEGAEIEVLKGINFNKYKFKFILVETKNLKKINNYLKGFGYKYLDRISHHDYLFKL